MSLGSTQSFECVVLSFSSAQDSRLTGIWV